MICIPGPARTATGCRIYLDGIQTLRLFHGRAGNSCTPRGAVGGVLVCTWWLGCALGVPGVPTATRLSVSVFAVHYDSKTLIAHSFPALRAFSFNPALPTKSDAAASPPPRSPWRAVQYCGNVTIQYAGGPCCWAGHGGVSSSGCTPRSARVWVALDLPATARRGTRAAAATAGLPAAPPRLTGLRQPRRRAWEGRPFAPAGRCGW